MGVASRPPLQSSPRSFRASLIAAVIDIDVGAPRGQFLVELGADASKDAPVISARLPEKFSGSVGVDVTSNPGWLGGVVTVRGEAGFQVAPAVGSSTLPGRRLPAPVDPPPLERVFLTHCS